MLAALAPPVQHEVNNLLTVLFANLESLKRALPAEGLPQRQIERVALASRRLDAVVRAFTVMARRSLPDPDAVEPAAMLAAIEPLLRLVVGSRLALSIETAADLPPVRIDRTLFDLGLLELARDAAARLERGAKFGLVLEAAEEGRAVALAVTALPPAPPAATLCALAETAGGRLERAEEPGGGTTLRAILPAARPAGGAA